MPSRIRIENGAYRSTYVTPSAPPDDPRLPSLCFVEEVQSIMWLLVASTLVFVVPTAAIGVIRYFQGNENEYASRTRSAERVGGPGARVDCEYHSNRCVITVPEGAATVFRCTANGCDYQENLSLTFE